MVVFFKAFCSDDIHCIWLCICAQDIKLSDYTNVQSQFKEMDLKFSSSFTYASFGLCWQWKEIYISSKFEPIKSHEVQWKFFFFVRLQTTLNFMRNWISWRAFTRHWGTMHRRTSVIIIRRKYCYCNCALLTQADRQGISHTYYEWQINREVIFTAIFFHFSRKKKALLGTMWRSYIFNFQVRKSHTIDCSINEIRVFFLRLMGLE